MFSKYDAINIIWTLLGHFVHGPPDSVDICSWWWEEYRRYRVVYKPTSCDVMLTFVWLCFYVCCLGKWWKHLNRVLRFLKWEEWQWRPAATRAALCAHSALQTLNMCFSGMGKAWWHLFTFLRWLCLIHGCRLWDYLGDHNPALSGYSTEKPT